VAEACTHAPGVLWYSSSTSLICTHKPDGSHSSCASHKQPWDSPPEAGVGCRPVLVHSAAVPQEQRPGALPAQRLGGKAVPEAQLLQSVFRV